jgi:hypothetical protein
MKKKLLSLYLIFLSFTSAFAVSAWLTIPTLFSIAFLAYLVLFVKQENIVLKGVDMTLLSLAGCCALSFGINFFFFQSAKQINHFFAYEFSILIQFIVFRQFLFNTCHTQYDWLNALKYLYYGVMFACLFGLFEFTVKFFSVLDIDSYIPRPLVSTDYDPTFLALFRIRSFVEESGHLSLFLEIFFPLVLWYTRMYRKFKWFLLSVIVIILTFVLTFSSIGFFVVFLDLVVMLSILAYRGSKKLAVGKVSTKYIGVVIGGVIVLSVVVVLGFDFYELYNNLILLKLESSSGSRRSDAIFAALDYFKKGGVHNLIVGFGPGAYDVLGIDSIISLYVNILFELGGLGIIVFLLFVCYVFANVFRVRNTSLRIAFFLCIFNGFLHYTVISNYWYPWIWVITALLFLQLKLQREQTV